MGQLDNTAEKRTDISTGTPTSTSPSTGIPPSADPYLANIYAYREQIEQISRLINSTPQWELARDYEKIKNIELQIADVIDNLENLRGNPLGEKFSKVNVLKNLNTARVELNTASRLAASTDEQVQIMSFNHIVECRGYLNLAKGLMPFPKED